MQKTKIYKKNGNKLIIEEPFYKDRICPWTDEVKGTMNNFVGLITEDEFGNEEMGLAERIDMSYKGKGDQWTSIKYHFWGDKKEFEELCKDLGIGIVYA